MLKSSYSGCTQEKLNTKGGDNIKFNENVKIVTLIEDSTLKMTNF